MPRQQGRRCAIKLAGKVAVVTGAGRGIGRAIAERFAAEGAAVVIAEVDPGTSEAAAAGITAAGGRALAVPTDAAVEHDVRRLMETTVERFGRLDVLVNNAAVGGPRGDVTTIATADWLATLAVDLTGPFLCAKYAVPHLRRAGGGAIINVASVLGVLGLPGDLAYGTCKAGLLGLTRVLALDHARENIRVNAILPGSTDTPMMWGGATDAGRERIEAEVSADIPTGRVARPAEIAAAALFLASDEASYVVGATLVVDGGLLCRIRVDH